MTVTPDDPSSSLSRASSAARVVALLLAAVAVAVVWITNIWLTDRFTETTRDRAELRLSLYSNAIVSEVQRNSVVPLLLSRDPVIISALTRDDHLATSQRLISLREEIGAASLELLNESGRTVAATDRTQLGTQHRNAPYFVEALRSSGTVFTITPTESGRFDFAYSRLIEFDQRVLGVMVVEVDLRKLEERWSGGSDAILVTDSQGQVIVATEPRWRGLSVDEALGVQSAPSAIARAIQKTGEWTGRFPETYLSGEAVLKLDMLVPFRGWRLTSFVTYSSVRERVNSVLALEIMTFAILIAVVFYLLSRRAVSTSVFFQRESAELRQLNDRLQQEIAERERVEKTLEQAEQTLAQSQKLAALGEMSAAVSHELNQPLAAMKTYLAGARLLLQRKRMDESLSSFARIDDLIDRMGKITRQLKSFARKGEDAFQPVDLREALSSALAIMEPQLKQGLVKIERTMPKQPILVMGDRIRLEQVIVNLLRNAMDATSGESAPVIELDLSAGETARLSVRDNGPGITDFDQLFEPFYTTKQPGDGVGLGLAISSGIVSDHGGRLMARNRTGNGAVFEMRLPLWTAGSQAAE
ncbi:MULTISPECIES: sensor histidine kinase [unclassified Dinoroseobacter]|uniref:sensor histidine kinase n=1 Tax=unclassified Dinoroseobacter TaxID=2620028 RepID=UPI003C7DD7BE